MKHSGVLRVFNKIKQHQKTKGNSKQNISLRAFMKLDTRDKQNLTSFRSKMAGIEVSQCLVIDRADHGEIFACTLVSKKHNCNP